MNPEHIIEAALLTASDAMSDKVLRRLITPELPQDAFNDIMEQLQLRWQNRALHLEQTVQGWRFSVDDAVVQKIPHLYEEKKPKYSRAVLETLAIIAYHQPVTRGQIEDIRGIQVSSTIMQTLSDRGWIEVVAYKDSPGKPALWATSKIFLQDFRLNSLSDLPSTEELGHLLEQQSN